MRKKIFAAVGTSVLLPLAIVSGTAQPANAVLPQECYELAYGIVYNLQQGNWGYVDFLYGLYEARGC